MNQVSKIKKIIIIKKKDKREVRERGAWRERVRGIFIFISLFVSFSDLRKSDRRFSSGLKAKLTYEMRATRGH